MTTINGISPILIFVPKNHLKRKKIAMAIKNHPRKKTAIMIKNHPRKKTSMAIKNQMTKKRRKNIVMMIARLT